MEIMESIRKETIVLIYVPHIIRMTLQYMCMKYAYKI